MCSLEYLIVVEKKNVGKIGIENEDKRNFGFICNLVSIVSR